MEKFDIIVCGGGCAGFCAAVAAGRMGRKVALVEKYNAPGGILTVLGNNSIDQFNNPYRSDRKMIIAGIGWEFILRLYRDGFARIPDMNASRQNHEQYGVKVNPVAAAKIMDDMLTESGVTLFYGQSVVDAQTRNQQVESILISTKSGLKRLYADIFIDCTGDGDLAAYAGAECIAGDGNGTFQPGTLRFYPAVAPQDKILNFGDNKNHVSLNTTDSNSITQSEISARQMIYRQMLDGSPIMAVAPAVAPREGRRIAGLSTMRSEDYRSGRVFDDSVCYSYWFVDIHREGQAAYIQYITHDKTPTIRLSSMISKDFSNLMMAGRCVSSDRETNSALRVKASCMAMGEAAGTAAAIALREQTPVADISMDVLKATLERNGAIVPGKEKEFDTTLLKEVP